MQVAEAFVLAAVIAFLYVMLRPLRRRLERWFARRLRGGRGRRAQVVVLARRRDGTFRREDDRGA
jgi:hypothetical protein